MRATAARALGLGAAALAAGGCGSGTSAPDGSRAPRAPLVLLVPGSGFAGTDAAGVSKLVIGEDRWHAWGLATRPVPYRAGRAGLADVERTVAEAHRSDPGRPLCLYGESSGGTWALVAAAHDQAVACVVAAAAPTDEESWRRNPMPTARYYSRRVWPRLFGGPGDDDGFEPLDAWRAARPQTHVLLLYAQGDPIVPITQAKIFARSVPRARVVPLARGGARFVHSSVRASALATALTRVRGLVSSVPGAR